MADQQHSSPQRHYDNLDHALAWALQELGSLQRQRVLKDYDPKSAFHEQLRRRKPNDPR